MRNYLFVALGSAAGGLLRLILGSWLQIRLSDWMPQVGGKPFPVGTLLVNASGSFVIGVLIAAMARRPASANMMYYLLVVGVCGGYTTFSTFSADTVALMESGAGTLAALNVAASLALAFAATLAGLTLARAALGPLP
jgi:fluoride exporter